MLIKYIVYCDALVPDPDPLVYNLLSLPLPTSGHMAGVSALKLHSH